MTQPTKEQWKAVEAGLFGSFGRVELLCDGYSVSLCKQLIGESKLAISVYVDEWFRGGWLLEDCEERRRFMRPVRIRLYRGAIRKRLEKVSKRKRKELGIDIDETGTYYMPSWPTFAPLRRHLARENTTIEIIEINGEKVTP